MPPKILILKVGTTAPSIRRARQDYDAWFLEQIQYLKRDDTEVEVLNVYLDEAKSLLPLIASVEECKRRYLGIIITGSPAMVSDKMLFSVRTEEFLRRVVNDGSVPIFGICYGHQLLAEALGETPGAVKNNPNGPRVGTSKAKLTREARLDELFSVVGTGEDQEAIEVYVSHVQSVIRLPSGSTRLASLPHDPNAAFRYKNAWGVQFHPEFDLDIALRHVAHWREDFVPPVAPECFLETYDAGDSGAKLLRRFVYLCVIMRCGEEEFSAERRWKSGL